MRERERRNTKIEALCFYEEYTANSFDVPFTACHVRLFHTLWSIKESLQRFHLLQKGLRLGEKVMTKRVLKCLVYCCRAQWVKQLVLLFNGVCKFWSWL